jgi:hypothetical protein
MKTKQPDFYLKATLTVIAVCLSLLTLKEYGAFPTAMAGTEPQVTTGNLRYGLVPVNPDGTVPVSLSPNQEVYVTITDITTRDVLNVNIEEVNGRSLWSGNSLPVTIED